MKSKLLIVLGVVVVLGVVSWASGLASISSVQEELKTTKLKLIGEQIKQLQEKILGIGKEKKEPEAVSEPAKSKEEMAKSLEEQIKQLELVVRSLKPKSIEEETAKLDAKIAQISKESQTAEGARLTELQKELAEAVEDYNAIQTYIKQSLEESIKAKQAEVLKEQIQALQNKVRSLPPVEKKSVAVAAEESDAKKASLKLLQDQILAVKAKILAEQVKALQDKVKQLKK